MESFQMEYCARCYHVYKDPWEAVVGEELECQREHTNPSDGYAVAVKKGETVVGHLPRRLSRIYALFVRRGESVNYRLTKVLNRLATKWTRNSLFTVL